MTRFLIEAAACLVAFPLFVCTGAKFIEWTERHKS